jgi:methionyl-tRNA formyltransferase
MKLSNVVLLAAQTARSQAYVQALVAAGLEPESVILLGADPAPAAATRPDCGDLFLPDLGESVAATCARAGIRMLRCAAADVNADETVQALQDAAARIVIFSGAGGQIVSRRVLELGSRFLHCHSGWLPQYRGSTTVYYALLDGDPPAVSALYLDASIDTGPVLARRTYPRPPAGIDVDRVYDPAIRADLLVRLMRGYAEDGALPGPQPQHAGEGATYYVIHPVLKHLALLSLDGGEPRR